MMDMTGVLGSYPMTREASGTSWQPDVTPHMMGHEMRGDWMLMGHVMLNAVYDWQDGPRGDEKAFVAGMIMGLARREFDSGDVLNLRAMLSPDPFMGKSGYPLLLAAGETADGVTPLVDRQHPHDLFMELSASYSIVLDNDDSLFVYAGLPGEPAFGPPAFMHRLSTMDSPEAPITHHWFDSTHITFGVMTAGWVHDTWKLEVSRFKGREPDEDRFDIEEPKFDSTSVRVSWNPTRTWSLQVSWADFNSPEQLEPEVDETTLVGERDLHRRRWPTRAGGRRRIAWGLQRSERGRNDARLRARDAPMRRTATGRSSRAARSSKATSSARGHDRYRRQDLVRRHSRFPRDGERRLGHRRALQRQLRARRRSNRLTAATPTARWCF